MPTYVCYLPPDLCYAEQKAKIAKAISERHSEATGAPPYFVQVQIEETRADRFLGGQLTQNHIWVRGDIRAGRTPDQRTNLMLNIMRDISLITPGSSKTISGFTSVTFFQQTSLNMVMFSQLQVRKDNGSTICRLDYVSTSSL
jgi:phenylpyruvate tautomerase PptA (4-oxalocrotonate tautomerase family)